MFFSSPKKTQIPFNKDNRNVEFSKAHGMLFSPCDLVHGLILVTFFSPWSFVFASLFFHLPKRAKKQKQNWQLLKIARGVAIGRSRFLMYE